MVVTLMMSMMVEMMRVTVIMEEKDSDQDNYTSSLFRSHRKKSGCGHLQGLPSASHDSGSLFRCRLGTMEVSRHPMHPFFSSEMKTVVPCYLASIGRMATRLTT